MIVSVQTSSDDWFKWGSPTGTWSRQPLGAHVQSLVSVNSNPELLQLREAFGYLK